MGCPSANTDYCGRTISHFHIMHHRWLFYAVLCWEVQIQTLIQRDLGSLNCNVNLWPRPQDKYLVFCAIVLLVPIYQNIKRL